MKAAFAMLLVSFLFNGCKEREKEKESRYVLHSAQIHMVGSGTNDFSVDYRQLFRIDTATGKTWLLIGTLPSPYWLKVEDELP